MEHSLLKNILQPLASLGFNLLGGIDKIVWSEAELHYSPVFIMTPPRSGSTLLYQLMAGHMATCYFSNLADRLRVQGSEISPALSAYLVKLFGLDKAAVSVFESYYGRSGSWGGPNEANGIWERWFPEDPHHVPPGYLSAEARRGVYRAVAVTERIFDRPLLNKCIRNSVRIEAIAEIFPTALFIQCNRNPLDIAQSLFVARTRDFPFKDNQSEDPRKWWFSVKPKEYETIQTKSIVEQVCEQVYYVEKSIELARQTLGESRFLNVDYKNLCENPHQEIALIVDFMNKNDAPTRVTKSLPDSFPYSTGCKIEPTDYKALSDCLERLYERPMELLTT